MSRLKRTALLVMAGLAACLGLLSCGGAERQLPEGAVNPAAAAPVSLPAPDSLRQPTETQSAYLKLATEFEQDLPFRNVGLIGGRLGFIPAKFDPLSYALYWLAVPAVSAVPSVQCDPGFDREQAWLGIANFTTNRWDFGRAEELQYGPQHRAGGMILVAVVCTSYDELEWLVAGGSAPPFVKSVSPRAMSAGTVNDFRVTFTDDPAQSYSWQFGGGLSITQSSLANPKFSVLTPGEYGGTLTVANSAGTVVHEFSYSVLPASQYEPLHLYAVPSKSTVAAGEEITVSIRTGLIPQSKAAVTARVSLQFPSELQYVADSFNTGAPGGDKWAIDGFWAQQPDDDAFFLSYPDSWLTEVPGPDDGLHHMEISLAAAKLTPQFGSGVLCNLKLKCSEPGTYALTLLEATDVVVTSFTTNEGDLLWHDISNDGQPSITVLP